MVKRKLAQFAGGTLGFIHGNVGGALVGSHAAGKTYDYMYPVIDAKNNPFVGSKKAKHSSFTKKIMAVARRPRVRRIKKRRSTLFKKKSLKTRKRKTVAGRRVKRVRRKSKKVKPTITLCGKYGFHTTHETYGGVSDPNSAYIIHSTYSRVEYARVIMGALYRKLFKKAGILIADMHHELPLSSIIDSTGFRVVVERKDVTGAPNTIDFDMPDNYSLQALISGNTAVNAYVLTLIDGSATQVFTRLLLYTKDVDKYRIHTLVNVETEVLHLVCSSELKVQNRTRGDQSADVEGHTVDEQILEAKVYNFSGSAPKVKSIGSFNHEWSTIRTNGMDLIRAAEFPSVDYQNMPPKDVFSNCTSVNKYMHVPGVVKVTKIYWVKSGLFNNVIQKFEPHMSNGTKIYGMAGKAQMIGFEELIRSDSTNIIQLKYERKYQVGAYFTTYKKPAALLTDLFYTAQNEYAP